MGRSVNNAFSTRFFSGRSYRNKKQSDKKRKPSNGVLCSLKVKRLGRDYGVCSGYRCSLKGTRRLQGSSCLPGRVMSLFFYNIQSLLYIILHQDDIGQIIRFSWQNNNLRLISSEWFLISCCLINNIADLILFL